MIERAAAARRARLDSRFIGDQHVSPTPYYLDTLKAGQSFPVPDGAVDPVLRTGRPEAVKVLIGTTALPPIGEPASLVRAYSLKRDALAAIAAAQPAAAALPAGPAVDPAGARPDSTGLASDSDQRPQP